MSTCLNCHCPLYPSAGARIYNCKKNKGAQGLLTSAVSKVYGIRANYLPPYQFHLEHFKVNTVHWLPANSTKLQCIVPFVFFFQMAPLKNQEQLYDKNIKALYSEP